MHKLKWHVCHKKEMARLCVKERGLVGLSKYVKGRNLLETHFAKVK